MSPFHWTYSYAIPYFTMTKATKPLFCGRTLPSGVISPQSFHEIPPSICNISFGTASKSSSSSSNSSSSVCKQSANHLTAATLFKFIHHLNPLHVTSTLQSTPLMSHKQQQQQQQQQRGTKSLCQRSNEATLKVTRLSSMLLSRLTLGRRRPTNKRSAEVPILTSEERLLVGERVVGSTSTTSKYVVKPDRGHAVDSLAEEFIHRFKERIRISEPEIREEVSK
ncbi:hypothetical protein M6B38_143780 [Iris pallida]|uniref:Uncharacterized protein n=1 Tax=Iris pallida TaxID=29817 RepID=A0AAX6FB09_IRIPA|nr:hypothetical protein M6B38_143780 [Iris pallida]